MVGSILLVHKAVENLQKSVDDGLAESVRRFRNLLFSLVSSGNRKIAALLGDDRLRPLDRPEGEVAAIGDRHRLGLLIHNVHFRSVQRNSLSVPCTYISFTVDRRNRWSRLVPEDDAGAATLADFKARRLGLLPGLAADSCRVSQPCPEPTIVFLLDQRLSLFSGAGRDRTVDRNSLIATGF